MFAKFIETDRRFEFSETDNGGVEITDDQHAALFVQHPTAKVIIPDANGMPILSDPVYSLDDTKKLLSKAVDDEISLIYSRFTRFSDEYTQREAAARAFVAGGYAGDAGPWVNGFAVPANKTASQAADIIIAQADALKAALVTLGGLRMLKYEIASATSELAAQSTYDSIIAQAELAVKGL